MPLLNAEQIACELGCTPGWQRQANTIVATFTRTDFMAAIDFVNQVARLAEQTNHHPDILVRWNKITLTLSTHDEGGLSGKDFSLARQINAIQ